MRFFVGQPSKRKDHNPLLTDGLRLEVQLEEKWAGGIHEWRAEKAGRLSLLRESLGAVERHRRTLGR